jgi:uncharacterized membrane protein YdjX (TVP38/TMEM64 family)
VMSGTSASKSYNYTHTRFTWVKTRTLQPDSLSVLYRRLGISFSSATRENMYFKGEPYKKQAENSITGRRQKTSRFPLILSVSILIIAVTMYVVSPAFSGFIDEAFELLTSGDEQRTREWVAQFGIWGPAVILIIIILQMFLFIIPNILLIFICILSYGPVWGGLLAWAGIFLASTVGYFIGSRLSRVIVDRIVSVKTQEKLQDFISRYGMKAIFVLRVSSLSNDGLSLVAGLLKMPYRRFITATLLGITPLITVLAIFGHNGRVEKGLIWVGGFLLLCLITYIIIDKRRSATKKS